MAENNGNNHRTAKRNIRVLLHCDDRRRDAVTMWALSILLQDRGYKVLVANRTTFKHYCRWYDPDIIILSHCFMCLSSDELAERSKRSRILVLPTEGYILEPGTAISSYSGVSPTKSQQDRRVYTSHITRLLAWGDAACRFVLNEGIYEEDQVAVVGNPRFDIYRTSYFDDLRARVRKPNVVGIAGDQVRLNVYDQRNPLYYFDQIRTKSGTSFDSDRDIEDLYWYMAANLRLQFEFTHVFSENEVGELSIRPHPYEYAPNYKYLERQLPNAHVSDNTEPFAMWLAKLQALVVSQSTSVVEGFITGTPVIALQPMLGDRVQDHLQSLDHNLPTLKYCHQPRSVEEAVDMATRACRNELTATSLDDPEIAAILKDHFDWPNQDLTLLRVVHQIDEVAGRDSAQSLAMRQEAGSRSRLLLGMFMAYTYGRYYKVGLSSKLSMGQRAQSRYYEFKYSHFFPQWHGWDRKEGSKLARYVKKTESPTSLFKGDLHA